MWDKIPFALFMVAGVLIGSLRADDPLPSWNETGPKQGLIAFVEKVTTEGSADFVPPAERIAVFDNDGTLWAEQPLYFQAMFLFDRIKTLAPEHPEWKTKEPFASVLKGDLAGALAGGEHGLVEMLGATHTGLTPDDFEKLVNAWIATARHPITGRLLIEMTYQPMLELLAYLRGKGFKTFIVSGGGVDFMRAWAERAYGIPPEQIVGSSGGLKFEMRDGQPILIKTADSLFVDDKEGKPIGIQRFIGRRPLMAFGNSDGDLAMLQWTGAGPGSRFCMYIHHTDAEREWAYDRDSKIGKLDKGLDEAAAKGWVVTSMRDDWKTIWSEQSVRPATNGQIVGNWLAEDIRGGEVIDNAQSTLEIKPDGTVTGSTSVNRYTGKATIDGQKLTFGPLATTRRAGPPALRDQEAKFTQALEAVSGFKIDQNGLLELLDRDGKTLIRFTRMR